MECGTTSWGKSSNCSKDQKTGDIEYVVPAPADSKMPVPLHWRQFQESNDQLRLNMKKKELKTAANVPNMKDMSPDIQAHMNHMEQARSQPKAGQ